MKVGIIQSNFIPWVGYFDFIASVDLFVFHDDLQYTKGDWRNRNKIKTPDGLRWVTVPVHYRNTGQTIQDTEICYERDWVREHLRAFRHSYRKAPHFQLIEESFFPILEKRYRTISELNVAVIRWAMEILSIRTPLRMSRELEPQGSKTDRLLSMLKQLGARVYLSGPAAKDYLDEEAFRRHRIGLAYKNYSYRPYPQLWGGFEPRVTVLDLIANIGPGAVAFLRSLAADTVAVPCAPEDAPGEAPERLFPRQSGDAAAPGTGLPGLPGRET